MFKKFKVWIPAYAGMTFIILALAAMAHAGIATPIGVVTTQKFDNYTGRVIKFNGRSGAVMPQAGDYSAAQVDAIPAAIATLKGDMAVYNGVGWNPFDAGPDGQFLVTDSTSPFGIKWTSVAPGSGASASSPYVISTPDASLSNAQVLNGLATGILKNTFSTGALSIATAGTDYCAPTSGTSILKGDGAGGTTTLANGTDYFSVALAANVNMPTAGVWYDAVSQTLTPGTWMVGGTISVYPTSGVSNGYSWRLTDGTNAVDGCSIVNTGTGFTLPAGVDFIHVSTAATWKIQGRIDVQANGAYITAGSTKIWGWRIGP